jgi:superfamily II DNA or RNA helicase
VKTKKYIFKLNNALTFVGHCAMRSSSVRNVVFRQNAMAGVYVLRARALDGYVKIGYSLNLNKRFWDYAKLFAPNKMRYAAAVVLQFPAGCSKGECKRICRECESQALRATCAHKTSILCSEWRLMCVDDAVDVLLTKTMDLIRQRFDGVNLRVYENVRPLRAPCIVHNRLYKLARSAYCIRKSTLPDTDTQQFRVQQRQSHHAAKQSKESCTLKQTTQTDLAVIKPYAHQCEVLNTLAKSTSHHITHIVLPCGIGKALLSLFYAQQHIKKVHGCVLIGVPSCMLQKQMVNEIRRVFANVEILLVGSVKGGTTNGLEVQRRLQTARQMRPTVPTVVLTTYQSATVAAVPGIEFDVKIGDECHHLCQSYETFMDVPAARALYMTATPLYGQLCSGVSMDDASRFGPCAYHRSTRWAIDNGLLADYDLTVVDVTDSALKRLCVDMCTCAETAYEPLLAAYAAVWCMLNHAPMTHALIYTNKQDEADTVDEYVHKAIALLEAGTVFHAALHAGSRNLHKRLAEFKAAPCGIVSCVYMFGEGFDMPRLNSVVFCSNMVSETRIVQSALRPIRLHATQPHKRASIILPTLCWDSHLADRSHPLEGVRHILRKLRTTDTDVCQHVRAARLTTPCNSGLSREGHANRHAMKEPRSLGIVNTELLKSITYRKQTCTDDTDDTDDAELDADIACIVRNCGTAAAAATQVAMHAAADARYVVETTERIVATRVAYELQMRHKAIENAVQAACSAASHAVGFATAAANDVTAAYELQIRRAVEKAVKVAHEAATDAHHAAETATTFACEMILQVGIKNAACNAAKAARAASYDAHVAANEARDTVSQIAAVQTAGKVSTLTAHMQHSATELSVFVTESIAKKMQVALDGEAHAIVFVSAKDAKPACWEPHAFQVRQIRRCKSPFPSFPGVVWACLGKWLPFTPDDNIITPVTHCRKSGYGLLMTNVSARDCLQKRGVILKQLLEESDPAVIRKSVFVYKSIMSDEMRNQWYKSKASSLIKAQKKTNARAQSKARKAVVVEHSCIDIVNNSNATYGAREHLSQSDLWHHIEGGVRYHENIQKAFEMYGNRFDAIIRDMPYFNDEQMVPSLVCRENTQAIIGKPRYPAYFPKNCAVSVGLYPHTISRMLVVFVVNPHSLGRQCVSRLL